MLFIVIAQSCSKSSTDEEMPLRSSQTLDLSYGTHNANKLDLYLPENRNEETKVVILLHGGFWFQGDKQEVTNYAQLFQSQGIAVVNMNYRLTGTPENSLHPSQVTDIQSVVDFISSKASEWKVSSDKIGIIGASSGGHLALLYTYAYNNSNKVKTAVSIAGPTNLTDPRNIGLEQQQAVALLLGGSIQQIPAAYAQASPITHIKASTRPTLLIHGKQDKLVPFHQSEDCKARLDEFKVENKLLAYENLGHENVINQQNMLVIMNEILNWINKYSD